MNVMTVKYSLLWLFGVSVALAATADSLPTEARERLEQQRTALRSVYIEYDSTFSRNNRRGTYSNSVYFEGNRFIISNGDRQFSFDGTFTWCGNKSGPLPGAHLILRKISPTNTRDLTGLRWTLPYFEAAGIHFPNYPIELSEFRSLEPVVLRFIDNSESTAILEEGVDLRVTCYVDDWVLVNIRKKDLALMRKELERSGTKPEIISKEMSTVERMRNMVPKRRVSMLLDSERGYALAEREDRSADGQLIARFRNGQWKYFGDAAMWLPGRSLVSYFTGPHSFDTFAEEPVLELTLTLNTAQFSDREAEFTLSKTAKYSVGGTWILDDAITETTDIGTETAAILTVAADGSLLRGSIPQTFGYRRLWIAMVLFILAFPTVLFFIWRSRSKKC